MTRITTMVARSALLAVVISIGFAHKPVQAQPNDMKRKMELEIEREFFLGYSGMKEICGERNPAQKQKIDASFATQSATASPEVLAWAKTPDFQIKLKKRLAEQRAELKKPDEAANLNGMCENMSK
jgi:hypothetical protein